jgi:hypothetical protein
MTNMITAAALRSRTLSTQATWRDRAPSVGTHLAMRNDSVIRTVNHNSIAPTSGFAPVNAGRVAYGAAKQAAPPRGVPR